jgi:hypothetical protein
MDYEFISVNCNPDAGIALISSLRVYNAPGEEKSKHPGDNTYYLGDFTKSGKKLACDLGNDQVVSVEGMYSDAHPRDDGFEISTAQKAIGSYFSPRTPIVIVRNLRMPQALEITTCQENTGASIERECSITRVPYEKKSAQ